ncbi:hypothetical protein AVEN_189826-1 [Araneus ventricosus]|uniref:Uncharacterized protein n=1 Tax=Araneus ventricosus TaxID=182803 RepID=A0A4Y2TME8_ARAVE|nr:hypothetical protein AVEN_189826-1 [Araneus ventricosus]
MFQKDSLPIFAQALSPRHPCHQTSDCREIRMAIYAERYIQLDSFMSVLTKMQRHQTLQQSSSVFHLLSPRFDHVHLDLVGPLALSGNLQSSELIRDGNSKATCFPC